MYIDSKKVTKKIIKIKGELFMAEKKMTILDNFYEVHDFLVDSGADATLVEFVAGRIEQEEKQRKAAAERRAANGGEKKDVSQSEYYTALREEIIPFLTTEAKANRDIIEEGGLTNKDGTKPLMPAQLATALKPLVEDGTVIVEDVIVDDEKDGLKVQKRLKGYKLA